MATTEKRVYLNLTREDLRILEVMKGETGENVNMLVKKALFYYYLTHFSGQNL